MPGPARSRRLRRLRPIRLRVRLVRGELRRAAAHARLAIAATVTRFTGASSRLARRTAPIVIIAALAFGFAATAAVLYGQFGAHPGRNADAWAARPALFTGTNGCGTCHADQVAAWTSARHAGVQCESCHGPLAGHPAVNPTPLLPGADSAEVAPGGASGSTDPAPSSRSIAGGGLLSEVSTPVASLDGSAPTALCLTCHRQVTGRPLGFPVIDASTHYVGPGCLVCHDAHTAAAPQPPIIRHPLAGLPECTVCHSPSGMRPLPPGHPTWSGSCLACHRPLQS